ncbi:hypothetical protein DH2020_039342 [Rehmannia glutinosa]|uniref:Major facilitator superfamily (MFS) profile domain-containing protein n=1 Tax=Rehmannia glutinosa TaxID=99300 RepID=A0ABR0UXR7_REHGL
MARIISKPDNNFFNFSYSTNIKASTVRTSVKSQPWKGSPFKQSLKFRVSCSIKGTEREDTAETKRILNGLEVNGQLKEKESLGVVGSEDGKVGFDLNWPPWKNLPQRYKLIGTTSLAFVVCNMDKVNLSIAIIPMSHQFGWNASMAGLVQSSFFWGYALSQLPGGWLAKTFGGRTRNLVKFDIRATKEQYCSNTLTAGVSECKVLEVGVLVWSLATALVPVVAGFMPGLIFSRILVGIGEGVSPSAATDMIARTIPIEERSRAVSFVFGGLSVGSVLGLLLAPPLIQNYGWGSVFYIFGSLGIAWFSMFQFVKEDRRPVGAPYLSWPQSESLNKSWNSSLNDLGGSLKASVSVPFYRATCLVRLDTKMYLFYGVFCMNQRKMLVGLLVRAWKDVKCGSEELNLDLTEAAWVSVLPPLASIFVTSIASQLADSLIANGVETTVVRKICQTIAFMSPATCMILSSVDVGLSPWEVVFILTSGLALSSFALSGLYCTHQDMSPEYAGVLLGITNTVGAVPGIVGVALTGYLLDSTHSWGLAVSHKHSRRAIEFVIEAQINQNSVQKHITGLNNNFVQ